MATQTVDSSNVARQSEKGVATFERPKGQSLFDTLRDYSGIAEDYIDAGRGIYDSVTGAGKGKPATTPKPPGPATEPKTDWTKYALIGGGVLALLALGAWFLKRH